jgi:hypothetical protein
MQHAHNQQLISMVIQSCIILGFSLTITKCFVRVRAWIFLQYVDHLHLVTYNGMCLELMSISKM